VANFYFTFHSLLGASVSSIAALLSTDFVKLVLNAIVIALPISCYAVNIWLRNFPYRINLTTWYFLFAALIAISVAVFTVGFQSIKAALMNPVRSLRSE